MAIRIEIPVDATWEAIDSQGSIGRVWLNRRDEGLEMWMYSRRYSDGSGLEQDWAPSHRKAVDLCRGLLVGKSLIRDTCSGRPIQKQSIRFKRIK